MIIQIKYLSSIYHFNNSRSFFHSILINTSSFSILIIVIFNPLKAMVLTEFEIIKTAVAHPVHASYIKTDFFTSEKEGRAYAVKMGYKVWSGWTKYVRAQCKKGRAVEVSGIGTFSANSSGFTFQPDPELIADKRYVLWSPTFKKR